MNIAPPDNGDGFKRLLMGGAVNEAYQKSFQPIGIEELDQLYDSYPKPMRKDDFPNYYRFLYHIAPKIGLFLELGCRNAAASLHLVSGNPCATAFAIDIVDQKQNIPHDRRIHFYQSDSKCEKTADIFDDWYFDAILIDTDHDYVNTVVEFDLWKKKVKPGGLIMFDDISAKEFTVRKFWDEIRDFDYLKFDFPDLHPTGWGFGVLVV